MIKDMIIGELKFEVFDHKEIIRLIRKEEKALFRLNRCFNGNLG
jgi:hypothetical protein